MLYIAPEQFDSFDMSQLEFPKGFVPAYYEHAVDDTHLYIYDKDHDEVKIKVCRDSDDLSYFIEKYLDIPSYEEYFTPNPQDNTGNE